MGILCRLHIDSMYAYVVQSHKPCFCGLGSGTEQKRHIPPPPLSPHTSRYTQNKETIFIIRDTSSYMNTYQALRVLNVSPDSSQEEIRTAYRKMALELHPDKNKDKDGSEFKKVTEAYRHLKKNGSEITTSNIDTDSQQNVRDEYSKQQYQDTDKRQNRKRSRWGAGPQDGSIPEQDWGRYTQQYEKEDPDFWKSYEKNFWDEYNARVRPDGRNGEYEKAEEPKTQPDLFVDVDKSLCIGCCSCEIIAPDVFEINKKCMMNPKSSVINQQGAGINKIMNAAQTCPTKAISIDNVATRERLYPY